MSRMRITAVSMNPSGASEGKGGVPLSSIYLSVIGTHRMLVSLMKVSVNSVSVFSYSIIFCPLNDASVTDVS
jgi:hypothetical protein